MSQDPLQPIALRIASLVRQNRGFWIQSVRRWAAEPPVYEERGILPIPLPATVSGDERISLLAAIHDACVAEVAHINPWGDSDALPDLGMDSDGPIPGEYRLAIRYEILVSDRVPELRTHWDSQEAAIELFLSDVSEELTSGHNEMEGIEAIATLEPNTSSAQRSTVEQPPLDANKEPLPAIWRMMNVFTDGAANVLIRRAVIVLEDETLTCNEKLIKIDSLLPFPPTASGSQLASMLGATKQAVFKTGWWKQNRKGGKRSEIARRLNLHRSRAKQRELPSEDSESSDD
jgi:hypothetical protein